MRLHSSPKRQQTLNRKAAKKVRKTDEQTLAALLRKNKAEATRQGKRLKHGTSTAYWYGGCRCVKCRAALTANRPRPG